MPTPPKESIKGTKSHQITAFEFAQKQYDHLKSLEEFANGEDFNDLPENERFLISDEMDQQNNAYETLRLRVEDY